MNWNIFISIIASIVFSYANSASLAGSNTTLNNENATPGYSPIGKRDPFRAPAASAARELASQEPIEQYTTDKFQLKAILRGGGAPQAMLQTPDSKIFIVTEGDKLGRERATVSHILNTEILLTERTYNYLGKETLYERILSLPTEDNINAASGGSSASEFSGGGGGGSALSSSPAPEARRPAAAPAAAPAASSSAGNSPPPFIGPNIK